MVANQISSDAFTLYVDTLNIEVDYTLVPPIEKTPDEDPLALAGKVPIITRFSDPPVRQTFISGKEATLAQTLTVDSVALDLSGKVSYIDPITLLRNPDSAVVRPGWQGFLSNIDERVEDGDGSTMYYDRASKSVTAGETLSLTFPSVPVDLNDEATVLGIDVVVRTRSQIIGIGSVTQATLWTTLYIDGAFEGLAVQTFIPDTFTNIRLTSPARWNQDWTQAQLNGLTLRLEFAYGESTWSGDTVRLHIDAVDLEIVYDPASPLNIPVNKATLDLGGSEPVLRPSFFSAPDEDTLDFTGKVPTLFRQDTLYTDPEFLALNEQSVVVRENSINKPDKDPLSLNEKTPNSVVNHIPKPGIYELDLTGKVPDPERTDNHDMVIAEDQLRMIPENAGAETTDDKNRNPDRVRRYLTGKEPTADRTENRWIDVDGDTLLIAEQTPRRLLSDRPEPLPYDISLAGKIPALIRDEIKRPGVVPSFALSGQVPIAWTGPYRVRLALSSQAPFVGEGLIPGAYALTLASTEFEAKINDVRFILEGPGLLALSGSAPSLSVSSQLDKGSDSRFISLSVEYDIEHIGLSYLNIT
jgi:hypothetical protein